MKVLAIQFRYLGDAVLMTPALRAIKGYFPKCSLHALVAKEVAPLLEHTPWLDRVWGFPRKRGRIGIREALPFIRALRKERFERSVDFSNNDRGALMSAFCRARHRLAYRWPEGFLGRNLCFTQTLTPSDEQHEVFRNLRLLTGWGIPTPELPEVEIHADPSQSIAAQKLIPQPAILCHLASSQPMKEWPLDHWVRLHRLALGSGQKMLFCSGVNPREQALLDSFKRQAPDAATLPMLPNLAAFLAVIKQATLFLSGDTGPLHFAAGLGVPTIALFGPTRASQWAPLGSKHRALQGAPCSCSRDKPFCRSSTPCLGTITPESVLEAISEVVGSARFVHAAKRIQTAASESGVI